MGFKVRVPASSLLRRPWLWIALTFLLLPLCWHLRHIEYAADPLLEVYLQIAGSLIAFTYAANALIRFRGGRDRIYLILALGFLLCGLIQSVSSLASHPATLAAGVLARPTVPLSWMVSGTVLALLLLAALVVEKRIPVSREPGRETIAAVLVVVCVAYLTSAAYFAIPSAPPIHPKSFLPRPWDLLPAGLFLVATVGFWRRLDDFDSALDRSLCAAAVLNIGCHLAASQSAQLYDAPFALANLLKVISYTVVLGGALLDNARLFEQVSHWASSDALTGLANYRRLLDVLGAELQRSQRTQRPFAVLLLDLDGLKKINDQHGHLVGSRALKRLGRVLSANSRHMDTAARYGGDEFALVLPEASAEAAARVAARICERLAHDGLEPPITVSVGVAAYPDSGNTIEKLLSAADRALYAMKRGGDNKVRFGSLAACL